ncbi:phosphoribosyltransferase [Amycolatopsis saalfeldensis]|uniref:Adenine phosphoribosyltransferase n=1 Tax=Amycolatopsis saalfeldensis TaxID=394193 RepID=A0A1H8QVU6_9PSEU|nr:phosphoribosyltransferase [Amycolatopsis saalfeldensis]SEO58322.1 adenine phosphoribosyltransferase [Amycolatopsis saalfeldensis]
MTDHAADLVRERLRWIDGHADVWSLFRDPPTLAAVVKALADPYRAEGVTAVCGVESRGFLLGGAVAVELGAGFVAVRKGGLFPGSKISRSTTPDYRGQRHRLRLQRAALRPDDRVLFVDDWIETGSQATTVRTMVEECGATWLGGSVIVDQLGDPGVRGLVTADELGTGP